MICATLLFVSGAAIHAQEQKDTLKVVLETGKQGRSICVKVSTAGDTVTVITNQNGESDDELTGASASDFKRRCFKGSMTGIGLAFSWFVDKDMNASLPKNQEFMDLSFEKSVSFSLTPFQHAIPLQKNQDKIGLVFAANWTVHNYRFNHNYRLVKGDDGFTTGVLWDKESVKNKLTTSFINIPVMFEFQLPIKSQKNRLIIDVGPYCGFRVGSHLKMVDVDGVKKKRYGNINLNPLQYGAMMQVGVKSFRLFGSYNLSTLFMDNKGPELYPVQVGVSFLAF